MTELQLYKYINDNSIEWHEHEHENDENIDVIIFPLIHQIEEFMLLAKGYIRYSENGIKCVLKEGYFAFWMRDLCDFYGIDLENVFC